jgi:DNA-binding winged helix-turn-helix (wHTH) protein/TolB-like protein/Flp pilus assembly protein TadD
MPNSANELYEFDRFRLDVSERILWREDEKLPLSEKAFDTLCALVRRGNHLVGKEELLNEIWAGAFVEENNLDKNVSILRQVLGERAGEGKFIETVRGHGFRFVADVHEVTRDERKAEQGKNPIGDLESEISDLGSQNENGSLNSRSKQQGGFEVDYSKSKVSNGRRSETKIQRTSRLPFIAIATTIFVGSILLGSYLWRGRVETAPDASIKTIAVLPFKPLVAGSGNEALELGMADALISKLSDGAEISVRPLETVRRSVLTEPDSLTIGRNLEAEAILDGSIQTSGDQLRISARLLRTSDGKQLWAGQFDEKFTDIFAVQDSISNQVVTALKIRLAGRETKRQTENIEAYQRYMKGRFHMHKAVRSEIETGISYFQQAIAADPNYALAYAGLADANRALAVGGEMPSAEFMPKAKAAALRAVELNDGLAEAHAVLGHILFWYDWDWDAAEDQFKRALELDPNSPDTHQFYAHLRSNTGRHAEALAEIKRARELDPLNLRINSLEGMFLLHAGQTDEALARFRKTLELDANYRLAVMFSARAYSENGMFAEAIAATNKAKEISADSSETVAFGAYALAKTGKLAEARAARDEMLEASKTRWIPPYNFALVYNAVGESGKALDHLEKAFAEKDVRMVFLKVEPKWDNLRHEPRFIEMIKRMNLEN